MKQCGPLPLLFLTLGLALSCSGPTPVQLDKGTQTDSVKLQRGRYLATVGVCEACHTPPAVPDEAPRPRTFQAEVERQTRAEPDWALYLDATRRMAGGVPFLLRFSPDSAGIVYSRNITPDPETGIGAWSEQQIATAIRSGSRPDGTSLFLFAPHTFYKNLAEDDASALAAYLKNLPPIRHLIPARSLPFVPVPAVDTARRESAPLGRTSDRASYLLDALIGCRECHSYSDHSGVHHAFAGGDQADPFTGVFRLGPDLPLRPTERGFATFPYPGFSILYAGNLTRFGLGGDKSDTSEDILVRAIRDGIATSPDRYGRPRPLSHIMMWQFYRAMQDDDAYAIADYLKRLPFEPHEVPDIAHYGANWAGAFRATFGTAPSRGDKRLFGKGDQ